MATLICIGFVELLKWISGFFPSARVVLNALVYNPLVDKGSLWAVFISRDEYDGVRTLVDGFVLHMGIMLNPCTFCDHILLHESKYNSRIFFGFRFPRSLFRIKFLG